VYDLYVREIEGGTEGDSKKYKRKMEVKDVQWVGFDEELGRVVMVSPHQMYQVRN
jgi:hypothetical protein